MTKWTAPDIASIRGDNSRPLQKIFGSLTEYLNGYTLDSLDDVTITTPTAGQTLSYDAVTSLWKNTSLSGSLSGNASTATNLSTDRTNWSTNGTISAVVGQLAWKNFGNSHTIFDASESTSPNGSAVNNTNSQVPWTGTYPTLMGWNGIFTYGVRVDSARTADIANSVGTLTSLTVTPSNLSSFTLGNTTFTTYSGIEGDKGYLLLGNSISDPTIYLRSTGTGGVYLGASNSNTLQVGNGTATVVGTMNATSFVGPLTGNVTGNVSGSAATVTGASQTAITALGSLTTILVGKVSHVATVADAHDAGSFSVRGNQYFPAVMSFHRTAAYAVNFGLSTANKMELGGWSAGTIKFTWDMATGNYDAVGTITAAGIISTANVTVPNTTLNYFGSANGSNVFYPMDTSNNMFLKVGTGNFYVNAPNHYFRNASSAIIMSLATSGAVNITGTLTVNTEINTNGVGGGYYFADRSGTGDRFAWYSSSANAYLYSSYLGQDIIGFARTTGQMYLYKGVNGSPLYGSYGTLNVYGQSGGWYGIVFPDELTTWMSAANGSYFGCYRNNNTWNFYVNNGTFIPSDERYKRDIEPLQHGMNFIKEIVPITFDPLTEDPSDDPEQTVGKTHYGFTTQNILQALANVGETRDVALVDIGGPANESNESDRQYLNHLGLIAPMVKAIQELDTRLQQLETV